MHRLNKIWNRGLVHYYCWLRFLGKIEMTPTIRKNTHSHRSLSKFITNTFAASLRIYNTAGGANFELGVLRRFPASRNPERTDRDYRNDFTRSNPILCRTYEYIYIMYYTVGAIAPTRRGFSRGAAARILAQRKATTYDSY